MRLAALSIPSPRASAVARRVSSTSQGAGRQRAMEGEVARGADRGDEPVDLRTQRHVGEGSGREGEREGRHQRGRASHGAEFEVNTRLVQ